MKRINNRFFRLGEWSNSQILPGVSFFFFSYDPTEDWVPRCLAEQIKSCPWKCKCNDQNITVKILQMVFPELQWVFLLLLLHVSAKNRKWKQSEKQCHIATGCCCVSSSSLAFFNSFTLKKTKRSHITCLFQNFFKIEKSKWFLPLTSSVKEPPPREMTGRYYAPDTVNSWKRMREQ